ncbi:hypothetical protein K9M42_03185 [Patescibacteria group bacterium]|nr:hypothetical protein [Patescibacteria group bacterium]
MKNLILFENFDNIKQPIFLSKGGRLYISEEFAKFIGAESIKSYNVNQRIDDFFNDVKVEHNLGKWYSYKEKYLHTGIKISYDKTNLNKFNSGSYTMNIRIERSYNNKLYKDFPYFISGSSGDFEMYGKSMVFATKYVIMNFLARYFPIIKLFNIKHFYKKLKEGEPFLDIINSEISNINSDNFDIKIDTPFIFKPKELKYYSEIEEKFEMLSSSNKFNL